MGRSSASRDLEDSPPQRGRSTLPSDQALDLTRYVPALFTFIAGRLSRGASQHYQSICGIGIETWRILVLLKVDRAVSATRIASELGIDKGSVSRSLKSMQASDLVSITLDEQDGRMRLVNMTAKGDATHDRLVGIALERERALLAVLQPKERLVLIDLLGRLHENLPAVETATDAFVRDNFPPTKARRNK